MRIRGSAVEIRCLNTGFEVVLLSDDEETSLAASRAIQQFPRWPETMWCASNRTRTTLPSTARIEFNCASAWCGRCTRRGCRPTGPEASRRVDRFGDWSSFA